MRKCSVHDCDSRMVMFLLSKREIMTETKIDEVKLVVGGTLLYHETKKVYAAVLTSKVVFYPCNGKPPSVLSTRVNVMSAGAYLDLVKDQPDRIETINKEIQGIKKEHPEAKCDVTPFMEIDTSKKPHWKHICGDGRHYAACSVCNRMVCNCPPGKGASPLENPHNQSHNVRCWLPAFE